MGTTICRYLWRPWARVRRKKLHHVDCLVLSMIALFIYLPNGEASYEMQGPSFVSEPSSRVEFTNVNGGRVDCIVRGNPAPTVDWLGADGARVTTIPGIRHVLENGTIYFPDFEAEAFRQDVHWAIYKCCAINSVGSVVSRDVTVRAVVAQRYDPEVQSPGGYPGNNVLMRCNVPSFVRDHVTVTSWLREPSFNIYPTIKSDGKYHMLPSGELLIINISQSDSQATYRCRTHHRLTQETIVSNNVGRIQLMTEIRGSIAPKLNDKLVRMSARLEEIVVIPCVAYGKPRPTNTWYYRRKQREEPIKEIAGHLSVLDGSLIIQSVREDDAGSYICTASNSEGSETLEVTLSVSATLSVHIQPAIQTVDLDKPAYMTCIVSGFPQTAFYWLKDGQPLRTGARIKESSRDRISITSVAREDRGMYQCFVRNELETAQGIAELRLGEISPQLIYKFIEQTMQPGPSVSLKCSASGNPTPQISWLLDGFPLPQNDRLLIGQYVTVYGDVISHVNISIVKPEDGGEYECTANSKAGRSTHAARLNIYGLPYVRSMPPITAVADKELRIKCPVAGYPIDSIVWEKDGSRLPTNMRQRVANGTLYIETVQRNVDNGTYTCTARNKHNFTSHRAVEVIVLVPPRIAPFYFEEGIMEGMRTQVMCAASQGDKPVNISWLLNTQPIPVPTDDSDNLQIKDFPPVSSILSIDSVTAKHTGNYTCRISNVVGSIEHTTSLSVAVPPRWTKEPVDQGAIVGHGVAIDCQAEGFPNPTVTWKQVVGDTASDYRELGYDGTEGAGISANGSLLIPWVSREHAGSYVCQASNGIGPGLSKLIRLTVHAGPRVTVRNRQESVRRDEKVTLRCEAEGDPPLDLNWHNRGSRLVTTYDDRYTVENIPTVNGIVSELRINQAVHSDRGEYMCVAGNAYGHDTATINLLVQEPPNFPRNLHVVEQASRSIRLAWEPPSGNSDPLSPDSPITHYIVQYKKVQDVWHEHNSQKLVAGENTVALVSPLEPATTYHFRVFAENHLGKSDSSNILQVQTDSEIPGGPPVQVIVEATGAQQLKITWHPPDRTLWNGELLGFTIIYTNIGNDDQTTNTTRVGITGNVDGSYDYRLSGLRKYTKYSIVVKAFNSKGDGPGSDPVTAQTHEDVPSAPPQSVACTALSGETIQITWKPPPADKVHGMIQNYKLLYEATSGVATEFLGSPETKITHALSTILQNLNPYTNYTVQVLACTRAGDGVASQPVSCTTDETVPDAPEKVKSVASAENAAVISWLPPRRPNGVLTKYNVYIRVLEQGQEVRTIEGSLPAQNLHYDALGLKQHETYEAWVTASTKIGQGASTPIIKFQTTSTIRAAIISFGQLIVVPWKVDVSFSCFVVGIPRPSVEWRLGGVKLQKQQHKYDIGQDNSLIMKNVQRTHEGNYSCLTRNTYGSDEIIYSLVVQVPPSPPTLLATGTTNDAVQLRWTLGDTGGAPVKGFLLSYRREYAEWEEVMLDRRSTSHLLDNLQCGTNYQFTLAAFNRIGSGSASKVENARTKGNKPVAPAKQYLIRTNLTTVMLELAAWQDGGCPLLYFVIEYRRYPGDWLLVSNNVQPQTRFPIVDLESGTSYELRVTAYNNAGSTQAEYLFSTLMPNGNTRMQEAPPPETGQTPLYLDTHVLAPSFIALLAVVLAVFGVCFCLRTHPMRSGVTNDPNSQRQAALENKHNMEQREQYYATVRKPGQQSPCREVSALERIPEYSEDIYPYATFHLPEQENLSANPMRQAYFYERSETMLQGAQCDVDQYTKVRGRSRRKSKSFKSESEEYDTLGSDSDTEVGTSSRTESSNHLDDSGPASMLGRSPGPNSGHRGREQRLALVPRPVHHNVLYHTHESSTSTEPSPTSERKTFPRLDKQRGRIGAALDMSMDSNCVGAVARQPLLKLSECGMRAYSANTSPSRASASSQARSVGYDRSSKETSLSRQSVDSLCLLSGERSSSSSCNLHRAGAAAQRSRNPHQRSHDWPSELSTLELKPPSGFMDTHETSEAECDIDMKLRIQRKKPLNNCQLSKSPKDFTITV